LSDIRSLVSKMENGELSAQDVLNSSLAIHEKTKHQNALVSLLTEQALEKAVELDKKRENGEKLGPLAGIPIVIKDNMSMQGTLTTCGSKILADFKAVYDSTVVKRLKAADAVILGKANMDEFAMGSTSESSAFGSILNPLDESRVPGGSSGGSAAVVSSGLVPASLGSDTGGSIRQPAACCGVVGLKPTYGRVSRYGLVAYASSLDQIGPITKNVYDSALMMNVISGHDELDCTSSTAQVPDFTSLLEHDIKGKVIGLPRECFGYGLDIKSKEIILATLDKLKAEGAILKEVDFPNLKYCIPAYYILATAEASSNLSRFDGVRYSYRSGEAQTLEELYTNSRSEGFGEEVKRRIILGTFVLSSGYYDAYYMQAQKVRRLVQNDFLQAFKDCDVIASPTTPDDPMRLGEAENDLMRMYLSDIYTVSVNLAGLPGISLPCERGNGIKKGIQFIGKAYGEASLLQMAAAVERLV
jgi:aspartyl-tRNA(Asn)/glutamyl-tRNA(Gln) amidotransferase subunit A